MTDKRWEFELGEVGHTVELEHNPFSNKRSIRADGRLLSLLPESQQPKERSSKHAFRIDGHTCEVVINYKDRKFAYDLILDGVSNTPEKYALEMTEAQTSEQVNGTRWAIIGLFLVIGIGGNWINWYLAHTQGYYIGELTFIAPAITFLAFYFMLFPKDFIIQYTGKFPLRMWVVIILAILIGIANNYAFEHGLY